MINFRNILVIIALTLSSYSYAQSQKEGYDKVYGLDPTLYNGKLYTFAAPFGAVGHQYLDEKVYTIGTATIKGIQYDSLLLNFDIVNQEFLLRFRHLNGTTSIISLSKSNLENIRYNNRDFFVYKPLNKDELIFQTIGNGKVRILFSWWKVLSVNNSYGESNMQFSKAHRAMYLFRDNQIFKFKNNRSFVFCFQKKQQQFIKQYLRQNNLRIKKLSDAELRSLIDYCTTI